MTTAAMPLVPMIAAMTTVTMPDVAAPVTIETATARSRLVCGGDG